MIATSPNAVNPRITVLIPVFRDWDRLRLCLAALTVQTWPAADFEIIAINNDAAPAPADFPQQGFTLLHEPRGHSYAARNAGLEAARGEVLAFTDADCCPEPDWLAAGWAALHNDDGAALAGGCIRIEAGATGLAADYDRIFAFPQERYVRQGSSVTANLFVKREVFDAVGPFRADMQSSGDFELCRRARLGGFKLVYAAHAVVWHPARDSLDALLRKNRRVAGGFRRREFEMLGRGRLALWRNLATMLRPRPRYWWRLLSGQEKTAELSLLRRAGVTCVTVLLYYHFAISVMQKPPPKDRH